MTFQKTFELQTHGRGMLDITQTISDIVRESGVGTGVAHVFARHTSCSLLITENADPDVRRDLETLAQRWAPDADPAYRHDMEGDDDMAAHARSVLTNVSTCVPVCGGALLLGTWQAIYLWEHRTRGHRRDVVVTVIGDR